MIILWVRTGAMPHPMPSGRVGFLTSTFEILATINIPQPTMEVRAAPSGRELVDETRTAVVIEPIVMCVEDGYMRSM